MDEPDDKSCIACGWTLGQQKQCHCTSHLKLFYGASTRGVWSIGSDVILKGRPDEGPKAKIEVKTLNFLAAHTDIPVPKVLHDWVDRDGRYFVLNERVADQTLEKAWPTLSESQKISFADQVIQVRKQLRSITSASIQCVDQSPCYPGLLFFDLEPRGPFHSDRELWEAISTNLQNLPQQLLEKVKSRLPKCEHGQIVGILDWEYAAYFPIWYEYASASFGFTDMDVEWKKLLQERFSVHGEAHEDAKAFWTDMCKLQQYPDLDTEGQEVLRRLS
ncbi:hypothetical protein BJY04DRAFT_233086 [Aspergillus karnatakaensis]|uniref:aminoglycoside phosphotransferase family protein n=1 Tax=Aspergillus karnatakaensis TaxID=1810916 RepID=UPI003CCD56E5